jgi:hypothetical protein
MKPINVVMITVFSGLALGLGGYVVWTQVLAPENRGPTPPPGSSAYVAPPAQPANQQPQQNPLQAIGGFLQTPLAGQLWNGIENAAWQLFGQF